MAHMYNKTSATLGRGAAVPSMYNKTRGSALASGQHQTGTPCDSMMTTAMYNKTSTPEDLIHHDDGNERWSCITNPWQAAAARWAQGRLGWLAPFSQSSHDGRHRV